LEVKAPKTAAIKKWIVIAAIAVILIVAIVFACLFLKGTNAEKITEKYIFYLKENAIYSTAFSNIQPQKLTDSLCDVTDKKITKIDDIARSLGAMTYVFNNSNAMFYAEKYTDNGVTLCYGAVDGNKKTVIDEGISSYFINSEENLIYYLKTEIDGSSTLYQHDFSVKTKIENNVDDFKASNDGKRIAYVTEGATLYFKQINEEAKKLSATVDSFYTANDLLTVYYLKDAVLYKFTPDDTSRQIANDVHQIINVYESGEIYYSKKSIKELAIIDYIENDLEPDNALYEELKERKYHFNAFALYYYKDTEVLVSDKYLIDTYNDAYAKKSPVFIFRAYELDGVKKIKLSSLRSSFYAYSELEDAVRSSYKLYLAIGGELVSTDIIYSINYCFSDDGASLYYINNLKAGTLLSSKGTLNKVTISNKTVSAPQIIDEDVFFAWTENESTLVYFKNYDEKNNFADLYVNGILAGEKVSLSRMQVTCDNRFIFISDFDQKTLCGTLKLFDGSNTAEIKNNVFDFAVTQTGDIAYLSNYDITGFKGTLNLFKNGASEVIDSDVLHILKTENTLYHDGKFIK
jgi:hypothetical protein